MQYILNSKQSEGVEEVIFEEDGSWSIPGRDDGEQDNRLSTEHASLPHSDSRVSLPSGCPDAAAAGTGQQQRNHPSSFVTNFLLPHGSSTSSSWQAAAAVTSSAPLIAARKRTLPQSVGPVRCSSNISHVGLNGSLAALFSQHLQPGSENVPVEDVCICPFSQSLNAAI